MESIYQHVRLEKDKPKEKVSNSADENATLTPQPLFW
jgi:hypothetical protein